jgi:hypothetical protein
MRFTANRIIGLATAALIIAASPVLAQSKGKGKGHDKDHDRDRDDRVIVESNGNGRNVPPGLAKKPGGMPPGQYKKLYTPQQGLPVLRDVFHRHGYTVVRTSPYGQSQYVYYRAPNGTLQRAIIAPGTTQLGFTNVPDVVLREVLLRLY